MDELTFQDADGVDVFYRHWAPPASPRGIVLVVHGASEHSGRYGRLADVLTAAGWSVYALDQRGHGATASSTGRGQIGPGGVDGLLEDIRHLRALARSVNSDVPVVLFGHSLGALVAQLYVERHGADLAGLVLSGSAGPMPNGDELAQGLQAAVAGGMAGEPIDMLGPFNAAFEPARTKFDWLSRDQAEVDLYVNDPLCGDNMPLTYGFLAALVPSAVAAMDTAGIARIPSNVPVLLLTGERDPVSNFAEGVRELERRLLDHVSDVTACYYPQARHEVLNELNRDQVHAELVAWLAHLPPA